jgi:hypothetical protein
MTLDASICKSLSSNYALANKHFEPIDTLFLENKWSRLDNNVDLVTYSKYGYETEYFKIKLEHDYICVTIPLKSVPYHYTTRFRDFTEACKYISVRFKEFTDTKLYSVVGN